MSEVPGEDLNYYLHGRIAYLCIEQMYNATTSMLHTFGYL